MMEKYVRIYAAMAKYRDGISGQILAFKLATAGAVLVEGGQVVRKDDNLRASRQKYRLS